MTSNRVSRMNAQNENLGINDCFDRKHRVRNQSCSASSTMSSTSSNSSSTPTSLNQNFLIDVLIVYPNGFQIAKKLDSRKAVYDILIELSATAKLIPTNYTLKLFSKDEGDANSNNYKLIDYTPNQTIGHLNPAKINILPKTSTLKHQQHQLLTGSETKLANKTFNQFSSLNTLNNKSSTPFELTIRIGINLPHNQKTAVRVKPDILLADLFECVCKEADLDSNKYDLVINSKIIQSSMRETFDSFKTNEVTLVLKNSDKSPSQLNSKSSISIFNQHSTKSRSQKKLITNKTTNQQQQQQQTKNELALSKFKSKSELDLSVDTKINLKNSTSNLSVKSSNMFSFFTRKKNQKSKSKVAINEDNRSFKSATLIQEPISYNNKNTMKSVSSSQIDSQFLLAKTNKKRHAPPPPPLQSTATLNAVPEINEPTKQEDKLDKPNPTRSKSVINERNTMSDLDREALEKIMALTKKKKKAAPLPPTQPQPDSLKVLTNLSPKSRSSNENLSSKNDDTDKCSTSPPSFPSPSLSESSSISSNKNYESAKVNDNDPTVYEVENNSKCSLTSNSYQKTIETCLNQGFESMNQPSLTSSVISDTQNNLSPIIQNKYNENKNESILNETVDTKKPSEDSILISDENCVKSFYGAVSDHKILSEDDFSDAESIKTFNSPFVTTSPLHNSKYAVQSMPNQVTKIVINKNSPNKSEVSNTLKLDTKIPNVIVEANDRSSVQNYDTDSEKAYSDSSKNYSDQETQLEINIGTFRTPIKQTAVIEVRPEFETSSLITIASQQPETISQENSSKSPQTNEIKKSTMHIVLKSPVSPPPQFPAIGANEINEQHQNYTVVRSGDIIEKNGIYYSTDGTIRGYSGIVKKLASSKQLKEVFQKQQELEQQHEREYQLELQKKELEEKLKQSSAIANNRSSIGKIVASEKKTTPISTGQNLLKTVQYRKSPETRNLTTKSTLDDELSKKLESRRQTIANQINNLEIDTSNTSSLQSTSSSCTSPSIDSSSQNSPQSYFMPQNLHSINQRKNTPAFVLSAKVRDSNYSLNKIGYTNSPEQLAQSRASLLDELKSMVSYSDGEKTLLAESPTTPVMSTFQPKNSRPLVAPKNFNHNTIETIQNKKQILNARDDLLDSIKSFSVTSLKKVNREAF